MRTSHYLQNIATQVDKIETGWIVYEDKGISGRFIYEKRPTGKKHLSDVRDGKINEVSNRLGRSVKG